MQGNKSQQEATSCMILAYGGCMLQDAQMPHALGPDDTRLQVMFEKEY